MGNFSRFALGHRMPLVLRSGILVAAAASLLSADVLTLRSGEVVEGTFLGGTARQIRMDLHGQIRTFDIGQVQSVTFSDSSFPAGPPSTGPDPAPYPPPPPAAYVAPPPPPAPPTPVAPPPGYASAPAPPQPSPQGLTIPADTQLTVRMIDAVDSETARLGQTFRASVDEPVFVNGQEVIPRGADVLTKLVQAQQSGKIEGRTELTLALAAVTVNGRPIDVTSSDVKTESGSRGARSGKVIGGTAALGAIIGALAGGGKGAAIGATSGAAAGTGVQVLTGGQKVKIPSETRLTFQIQSPVQL